MTGAVDEVEDACIHVFRVTSCCKESGTLLPVLYVGRSTCVFCGVEERFELTSRSAMDSYTAPYYEWLDKRCG